MPLCDAVIKENLRLSNVVDGVWRKAKEPLEVSGMRIPKVCIIPEHP